MYNDQNFEHIHNMLENILNQELPPATINEQEFLETQLSRNQQEIVLCKDPWQTIFGGKRGGKSATVTGMTFHTDQFTNRDKPGVIFYGSTTAEHAKRLCFDRLVKLQKSYGAKWHYQMSKNTIKTQSNVILFGGLKDIKTASNYQGLPFKLVVLDEAHLINDLVMQYFIDEIVSGGLFDHYPHSRVIFAGNPFPIHSGYIWDAITNPKYTHHSLSIKDNEWFSQEKKMAFINDWLERRGETMKNPSNVTRRMLFGEHVADDSMLVLNFTDKDKFEELTPEQKATFDRIYDCSMGVDLGFDDKTAICVTYYDPKNDIIYLDYEFQESAMTVVPLANHIKNRVFPIYNTKSQNIIDTQGGGKQTAMSLTRDYSIPIISSKKGTKMHYVSLLRSYNQMHKIKVKDESALKSEARHILFNKHHTKIDDDSFHSDIFHAVLYSFRFIYQKHIEDKQNKKAKLSPVEELHERIKKQETFNKNPKPSDYGFNKTTY